MWGPDAQQPPPPYTFAKRLWGGAMPPPAAASAPKRGQAGRRIAAFSAAVYWGSLPPPVQSSSATSDPAFVQAQVRIHAPLRVQASGQGLAAVSAAAPAMTVEGLASWLMERTDPREPRPSAEYLRRNAELALRAREEVPAAADVPEALFLRDVLPYRQLDEPIDDWRPGFFEVLAPHAARAETLREVVEVVFPLVWTALRASPKVLPRPNSTAVVFRPNCTPQVMAPISETLTVGHASCTGSSILAADALRAVGVPARVVGTPEWNSKDGGNHNWVEAWTGEGRDGWQFFDAAPAQAVQLNQAWFVPSMTENAEKGTIHGIYTPLWDASAADAKYSFGWRSPAVEWPAEDRTEFYLGLR